MTDEERKEDKSDEEESNDAEELSNLEKWKRVYLRRVAEKAAKKFEKSGSRKVDKGFEDAFGGQENAHKYYRHHDKAFKYAAEPKDKVPDSKPTAISGEPWKEPSKWIPPKPTENQPRKDTTETLQVLEKPIDDHGRAERADGEGKDAIHKAEALAKDRERKDSGSEDTIAAIEIEAPAHSVPDVTSQIATQMKVAGYDHISTETSAPDYTFEPSFLEDDLEKMESAARQDSVSPLELSDIHETLRQHEIENILEEQRQELLQDFEIEAPFHDEIAGATEPDTLIEPPSSLENPTKPRHEIVDAEME